MRFDKYIHKISEEGEGVAEPTLTTNIENFQKNLSAPNKPVRRQKKKKKRMFDSYKEEK